MFSVGMFILLVTSMLALAFNIQPVKASGTIYIKADGSIDPPTAPISTSDNITYTLTAGVYESIVVERDNIVLDGAGFTIQGDNAGTGISLSNRNNVTINNTNIKNFSTGVGLVSSLSNTITGNNITANNSYGIWLDSSSNSNSVSGNNITNNYHGIELDSSSNSNSVSGNNVANNVYGIWLDSSSNSNSVSGNNITNTFGVSVYLYSSSNNSVSGNNITANNSYGILLDYLSSNNSVSGNNVANNYCGIMLCFSNNSVTGNNITANNSYGIKLHSSSYNTISGNNIANNGYGIELDSSSNSNSVGGNNITANNSYGIMFADLYPNNNRFYHNNFVDNHPQVGDGSYPFFSRNIWDDGYPSGGNYWSDFAGIDLCSGPYQNETGSDGIGDTPYSIDANNQDNYPLMYPYVFYTLTIATTAGGTTNPSPGVYTYAGGSNVQIAAIPDTNYALDHWELDSSWNYSNPIDVVMDSDHTLRAVFTYSVTITAYCNTEGASVSVVISMDGSPTGYTTPHTFTNLTEAHTFTVPDYDADGHQFKQWNTSETNTTITVISGGTYTAYYDALYALTITTTTGGTTNPAPSTYTYWSGTTVNVTAIPNTHYILDHWELNGTNVSSANPISILIDNNHTLHSVFSLLNCTLTITASTGGTTDPAPNTYVYSYGSNVSVTAMPYANYIFDHWELNGTNVGSANPINVTMDADYMLHADFRERHDVAVINLTNSPTYPLTGQPLYINVTVENQGDFIETFSVSLNYTHLRDPLIGTQNVTDLLPDENRTLTFEWTTDLGGRYELRGEAMLSDDIDQTNNNLIIIVRVAPLGSGSYSGELAWASLFALFASVMTVTELRKREPKTDIRDIPAAVLKQNLPNNSTNLCNQWTRPNQW